MSVGPGTRTLLKIVVALIGGASLSVAAQAPVAARSGVALEVSFGLAVQTRNCQSCPDQIDEPQVGPSAPIARNWRVHLGVGGWTQVLPVVFDAHANYGTRMLFTGVEFAPSARSAGDLLFVDGGYGWHSRNGDQYARGALLRCGVRAAFRSAHPASGIALTFSQALAGTHPAVPPSPFPDGSNRPALFPAGSYRPSVLALEFNFMLPF